MDKFGRTDSPATPTPRVALIERSTWWAFIESRRVLQPGHGVAVNLALGAKNIAELVASGAQWHVVSPSVEATRGTLVRLRVVQRSSGVDFGIPKDPDDRCVGLPHDIAERAAFLARYSVIAVIGSKEVMIYHLEPTLLQVPREEAPAGVSVAVTA